MQKLNLGCGKHPFPVSDGWVNVDKVALPGVDKVVDIFRYPWDFPDNTFDEFYMSHIVEHIPHEAKQSQEPFVQSDKLATQSPDMVDLVGEPVRRHRARWNELKDLDGFFCFFGEVWRIGVDGAKVHIITPFVQTLDAFSDPTHVRYMTPVSFAYLTENTKNSPDFDYQIPFLYIIRGVQFDLPKEYQGKEDDFAKLNQHMWGMTRNMYVELEIVK